MDSERPFSFPSRERELGFLVERLLEGQDEGFVENALARGKLAIAAAMIELFAPKCEGTSLIVGELEERIKTIDEARRIAQALGLFGMGTSRGS